MGWRSKLLVQLKNLTVYAAVILTLALIVGYRVDELKSEFNNAAELRCVLHEPRITKYNALVETLRNQQLTAEKLNLRAKNGIKAAADAAYAAQLQSLSVPPDNCTKPLLP